MSGGSMLEEWGCCAPDGPAALGRPAPPVEMAPTALEVAFAQHRAEMERRFKVLELRTARHAGALSAGSSAAPVAAVAFDDGPSAALCAGDDRKECDDDDDDGLDCFDDDDEEAPRADGGRAIRDSLSKRVPRLSMLREKNSPARTRSMRLYEQELVGKISDAIIEKVERSHYNYAVFRLLVTTKRREALTRTASAVSMLGLQLYVLLVVSDATWLYWFNRRVDDGNFERADYRGYNPMPSHDRPNNWAALTQRWGEWDAVLLGLPVFTLLPLIFAVLMVALNSRSQLQEVVVGRMLLAEFPGTHYPRRAACYLVHFLRVMVLVQFIDSSVMMLGLANGPVDLIVDALALIFILEFDKTLRLGSKKTLFGEAKAESRRVNHHAIDALGHKLARPVYAMGTRARQRVAHLEDGALFVVSTMVFLAASKMQQFTSRGVMTHPDDPSQPALRRCVKVGTYTSTAVMLLYVNWACRASATDRYRRSRLGVVVVSFVEFVFCVVCYYVLTYVFLSEALTFGDFDKAYLTPGAILHGALGNDDGDTYTDDIFKPGDE